MPVISKPQRLFDTVELIDIWGWHAQRNTGALIIQGHDLAIIETGETSSGAHILASLEERNIPLSSVRYVCVTHRHGDHCGGATPLAEKLPRVTVAGHKYALATLQNPERLNVGAAQLFGSFAEKIKPLPAQVSTLELKHGDILDLGLDVQIEVIETPGHTSDHLAYYEQKTGTVYTGDAAGLFGSKQQTVTPTSFPPSFKYDSYRKSLERIKALKPSALVFAHFGAVTGDNVMPTLERALSTLEAWRETVEMVWEKDPSQKAITKALSRRFLHEIEVFPPEARPIFIQAMALGLSQSLYGPME